MALDKQLIANLRYLHGSFNLLMMLMFFIQGYLGFRIRKARTANIQQPLTLIKRHRMFGPILFILGIGGFFSGLTLVYLDHGNIVKFPIHLFFGVTLTVFLINLFFVSRMIKGTGTHWRDLHYKIGIAVLCIYIVQSLLGIGMLL
jgi:hypothetical protein